MKESMNDAKKVTPLSIEELMEMSYKDLLKLTKKKTTDEVTKRRAWKILRIMRNSFFTGMKRAYAEYAERSRGND